MLNIPTSVVGFRVASLVPPRCDFDDSFNCNADDLNLLMSAFGTSLEKFNLDTSSETIDELDRDEWLSLAGVTLFGQPFETGDANLDGVVDAVDLNELGKNWLRTGSMGWSGGDFNGDEMVDQQDLNALGSNWQSDIRPAAALVPEPRIGTFVLITLLLQVPPLLKRPHR